MASSSPSTVPMFEASVNPLEAMGCEGIPSVWRPLENLAHRIASFHGRYAEYFTTQTRSVKDRSMQYMCGLIQAKKRNMERMAEVVPDTNDQGLQHFISLSPWDEGPITKQIGFDVDGGFGGDRRTALYLDETGIGKKGKKSVGVGRQWNGRLGKVDNCQVVVFSALGCGDEVVLINERLYLPKDWIEDAERCEEAGIPEEVRVFRTKSELALELVRDARAQGLRFSWVGMDGGYGKEPWFLRALDTDGEVWVADVHSDQRVYLEDPQPIILDRRSSKGKSPSRLVAQTEPIRVDDWASAQPESAWKPIYFRESTKGTLIVLVLHRRVWLWDGEEGEAHCWHLIVRREMANPGQIKYTLSNAPESTSIECLVYMQGQRYWIEHGFQEAKTELGMAEYQLRLWRGFHHHMAMVMLTMLFFFEIRRQERGLSDLLSFHDIREVLCVVLPRADVTYEQILGHMKERHRRRQASIDSAYRKQGRSPKALRGP